MNIKISKKNLEEHLNNVSRALVGVLPIPALTGILIIANESNIQLIVSNGNLSIKEVIELDLDTNVLTPGKILVPGKIFKDAIRKHSSIINILTDDNFVHVNSNDLKMTLNLLDANSYPVISFDEFGKEFLIEYKQIEKIIKNVSFAASVADRRVILNGVNLKARNGELIATATNSFRMAREKIKINSDIDFDINIFAQDLKTFLPQDAKGEIKINVDDNKIITSYKSSIIVSRLIDGVYPEVDNLIPKEFKYVFRTKIKPFVDAIEKVTIISSENYKTIKLLINNQKAIIESRRKEVGESEVVFSDFDWNGEEFVIIFNYEYLKDALSKFKDEVEIKFNDPLKPFIVLGESEENNIQLILPHRSY